MPAQRTRVGRAPAPGRALLILCLSALSTLALAALAPRAQAGPWSLRNDTYYAEAAIGYLSTSEAYDVVGDKYDLPANGKYRDVTANLRALYGVSDRWTLEMEIPVRFLRHTSDALEFSEYDNGLGAFQARLRYGLRQGGNLALAVQLEGITPTGYNAEGTGRPALGRGKSGVGGRLLAGYVMPAQNGYVQAEYGYRLNESPLANEFVGGAEVGVWASPRALLYGDADWRFDTDDTRQSEDYTRAGLNLQYQVRNSFHVMAGVGRNLSGKNVPGGTTIRVGVALKGHGTVGPAQGRTWRPDAPPEAEEATAPEAPAAPAAPAAPEAPKEEAPATPTPTPGDSTP